MGRIGGPYSALPKKNLLALLLAPIRDIPMYHNDQTASRSASRLDESDQPGKPRIFGKAMR